MYKATLLFLLLMIGAGCRGESNAVSDTQPISEATETAQQQENMSVEQIAAAARDELFQRLSTRLMEVMGAKGPVAAIKVCSQAAPQLAEKVGKSHSVKIGRTSQQLRNSDNTAPAWAQPFVDQATPDAQFVSIDEHTTGALFPIRLKEQCLVCHGDQETVNPDVIEQLAQLYPNDKATGYKAGDLRGWFWVEVPNPLAAASTP